MIPTTNRKPLLKTKCIMFWQMLLEDKWGTLKHSVTKFSGMRKMGFVFHGIIIRLWECCSAAGLEKLMKVVGKMNAVKERGNP